MVTIQPIDEYYNNGRMQGGLRANICLIDALDEDKPDELNIQT